MALKGIGKAEREKGVSRSCPGRVRSRLLNNVPVCSGLPEPGVECRGGPDAWRRWNVEMVIQEGGLVNQVPIVDSSRDDIQWFFVIGARPPRGDSAFVLTMG